MTCSNNMFVPDMLMPRKDESASLSVYCFESLFIGLIFLFTIWGTLDHEAHNLSIFFAICCALTLRRAKSYYKSYDVDYVYDKMTAGLILIIFLQMISYQSLITRNVDLESTLFLIVFDLLIGFFLFFPMFLVLEFAIICFCEYVSMTWSRIASWTSCQFDCLSY